MLVNSIILGKIECDPEGDGYCLSAKTYLAAFGLGSSLMSILLLASGLCYVLGLN
jgi:Na+-driven multidrug efflux pump